MNNIFNKLVEQEKSIIGADFVVCPFNFRATIKVANTKLSLKVNSNELGVYRVKSYKEGTYIREPNFQERSLFLDALPLVRMMICHVHKGQFFALNNDGQFEVRYVDNAQLFDKIVVRFDGANFIFHELDRQDFRVPQQLRECLEVGKLNDGPFSLLDKECFKIALVNRRDPNEVKIKDYVSRAGGKYKGHKQNGQNYTVTYEISGQTFSSVVNKNLMVEAAGICLSGTDREYDLQSLISVVNEGIREGKIYRVGI